MLKTSTGEDGKGRSDIVLNEAATEFIARSVFFRAVQMTFEVIAKTRTSLAFKKEAMKGPRLVVTIKIKLTALF